MNARFVAILLTCLLGLQSVAPMAATAFPEPASHCGESVQDSHAAPHGVSVDHECPHCSGDTVDPGGCASYCASAIALTPAAFTIGRSACAVHAISPPVLLHSRFDIPPTPPPIY